MTIPNSADGLNHSETQISAQTVTTGPLTIDVPYLTAS